MSSFGPAQELIMKLCVCLKRYLVQVCRMFQGCSIGWFRTFVQYLEPAVALEGEAVFAEKDLPTHLSFVQSGTVKLHLGMPSQTSLQWTH